jgi:hypothetical protein
MPGGRPASAGGLTNRGESGSITQMSRSTKWIAWSVLALTGTLAAGCSPTEYTDVNFGTETGADYVPPKPAVDAGLDADAAAPSATGTTTGGP